MRAMVLEAPKRPLVPAERPPPVPGPGQILIAIEACAVCRTDLHVADGELPDPKLPLIPGHEIAGTVAGLGEGAGGFAIGDRAGVPWLGWACGACAFCRRGQENLCDRARFTGYQIDGGYAELTVADARFCFPIPAGLDSVHAAPLLCAGLIGYRTLRFAGDAERIGLYGFGAAAHLVAQIATREGRRVFAFTRPGDTSARALARRVGCVWAGASGEPPPEPLDAALIFAPVGALIPEALRAVRRGGVVVSGGIHMSDVPSFPYALLWGERVVRSVANLTRKDALDFFDAIRGRPLDVTVETLPLEAAQEALDRLRSGHVTGALVLAMR